jgi:hypothetical protein
MHGSRSWSYRRCLTTAFVGSVVIWLGPALIILRLLGPHAPGLDWMLPLAKAVSLAWLAGFSWLAWRRLDEVRREAQKFAWSVSTAVALMLTAPVMLYVRLSGGPFLAHLMRGPASPGAYFAMGWGFLAVAEMAGFLIAWFGWWAMRQ